MNSKQSKRLMSIAVKHAKVSNDDSLKQETIFGNILKRVVKGEQVETTPSWTTRRWTNGSAKRIYKELKRAFLACPRPERPAFLKAWEELPCQNMSEITKEEAENN